MATVLMAPDRRGGARRPAAHFGYGTPAVLRPGLAVAVVELSTGGALVESASPVRPGASTELGLDRLDGQRQAVRGQIVRCWVAALDPLRYRCAVRFEGALGQGSG